MAVKTGSWRIVAILLMAACGFFAAGAFGWQQAGVPIPPPKQIRLCTRVCETLTLSGEHFNAVLDGNSNITAKYRIERWDSEFVILHRTEKNADGDDIYFMYTGKIAASGDHILFGEFDRSGPGAIGLAPLEQTHFTAGWGDWKIRAFAVGEHELGYSNLGHRSKAHPNLLIPWGASEVYAGWDSETRAVLMEGVYPYSASLEFNDASSPCNKVLAVTQGYIAVEIAKYAYRANEIERGNCWAARGVALQSNRAKVLVALGWFLGWQGTMDLARGCREVQAIGAGDPWAVYMLSGCYNNGTIPGFAKDEAALAQTDAWLEKNGGEIRQRLDSDDIEELKKRERQKVLDNPPMKTVSTCPPREATYGNPRPSCQQTARVIDQDAIRDRFQAIDEKYNGIQ